MDDVLPLAMHFLGDGLELSDEARAALMSHSWPGNVRELRNSIERAKLLARNNRVQAADLSLVPARHLEPAAGAREADSVTREEIEERLRAAGGNVSRAAQSLGLSRQALYRRMERFGMRSAGGA
jgi:transcriptional regulator of acetoin/glycerol metabolism